jgi:hypothetical protein
VTLHCIFDGEVRILKARPLAGLLARKGQGAKTLDAMDAAIAAGATDAPE